jgi:demethylmenaquinone methyltransferase/2-methoxy-6-polyprenyl-1,4-benzoquinol methylase
MRMANRFYMPGERRAAGVNDLFAAVARRYDLINDLQSFGLHRGWKRKLVRLAGIQPGQRALDLCCGTGDIAFRLAAAGAEVAGVDFSRPMLDVAESRKSRARTRVTQGSADNPQFVCGDALTVPFPDASFEVVTVAYGLRNLADIRAGLREMGRVLKPGGRLLILDFGKPENALWRACYFAHLRCVVPILGRLFCGDAATHGYILESLRDYPAQRGIAGLLREQGWEKVRLLNLLGGVMSIHLAEKAHAPMVRESTPQKQINLSRVRGG